MNRHDNRRALLERLDQNRADAVEGPGFAVAMIDVDDYKIINESLMRLKSSTSIIATAKPGPSTASALY
ncbi:MAG: hypothetical protein ABW187_05585 [Dokdonella sp.]